MSGDLGYTPLHYAAMRGQLEVTEKLLALGADPDAQNEYSETPLTVALNAGNADVAKLLKRCKYYK